MIEQDILDKISDVRLSKYKNSFNLPSIEYAYAYYLWNKLLAGAFTPIMQSIEVSLRNAINEGIRTKPGYGWLWFTHIYRQSDISSNFKNIHHNIVNRYSVYDLDYLKENSDSTYKTKLDSTYTNIIKNGNSLIKRSYNQHVVGNLMLGTWVVLLSSGYIDDTHDTKLWPNLTNIVFPNAAGIEKSNLYNIFNDIRLFRNRISHNEPLWKTSTSSDVLKESIAILSYRYERLSHALGMISLARKKQVASGYSADHFNFICNEVFLKNLIDKYSENVRIRICKSCHSKYWTATNRLCSCRAVR